MTATDYLKRLIDEDNRIPLFLGINTLAVITGVGAYFMSAPPWLTLIVLFAGIFSAPVWLRSWPEMTFRSIWDISGYGGQVKAEHQAIKKVYDVAAGSEYAAKRIKSLSGDLVRLTGAGAADIETASKSMASLYRVLYASYEPTRQIAAYSASLMAYLEVHRGIAEQVRLLALNAGIEAARAGRPDDDFFTVADQVRGLAESSLRTSDEAASKIILLNERLAHFSRSHHEAKWAYEESAALQQVLSELEEIAAALLRVRRSAAELAEAVTEGHSTLDS